MGSIAAALLWSSAPLVDASAATSLIVRSTSDASNGEVSSVENLIANSGPDGISLREAIEATNRDPGEHTVRFHSALAGSTITLDSELQPLIGGGLTIDGDVDGDGSPDITLQGTGTQIQVGLYLSSSGNHLHALELTGFQFGVVIQPPVPEFTGEDFPTHSTFADNTISNLVMYGIRENGITLNPGALGDCGQPPPCRTYNTWTDTTITDNTIEAQAAGIDFILMTTGERVVGATVTGNTIRSTGDALASGISFQTHGIVGGEASKGARISDVLIARNSVEGSPDNGISVAAGTGRGQEGIVERVEVLDNQVHVVGPDSIHCCGGIIVAAGSDIPDFAVGPPVRYLDDNVTEDVIVRGNTITGRLQWGIGIHAGFGGGGRDNQVRTVLIERNVIRSTMSRLGVFIVTGDGEPYRDRYSSGNLISGISMSENTIEMEHERAVPPGAHFDPELAGGGVGSAGIALIGGHKWGRENTVRDVSISENSIDNRYGGITVIGGMGSTASGNDVVDVRIGTNVFIEPGPPYLVESNLDGASGNRASVTLPAPGAKETGGAAPGPPASTGPGARVWAAVIAVFALAGGVLAIAVRRRRLRR